MGDAGVRVGGDRPGDVPGGAVGDEGERGARRVVAPAARSTTRAEPGQLLGVARRRRRRRPVPRRVGSTTNHGPLAGSVVRSNASAGSPARSGRSCGRRPRRGQARYRATAVRTKMRPAAVGCAGGQVGVDERAPAARGGRRRSASRRRPDPCWAAAATRPSVPAIAERSAARLTSGSVDRVATSPRRPGRCAPGPCTASTRTSTVTSAASSVSMTACNSGGTGGCATPPSAPRRPRPTRPARRAGRCRQRDGPRVGRSTPMPVTATLSVSALGERP